MFILTERKRVITVTVKEVEFFTLVFLFVGCLGDFHLINPNAAFWINFSVVAE